VTVPMIVALRNIWKILLEDFGDIVKTGIIGSHAKTSRIPSFGLGGKNTAKKLSFSLPLRQTKRKYDEPY